MDYSFLKMKNLTCLFPFRYNHLILSYPILFLIYMTSELPLKEKRGGLGRAVLAVDGANFRARKI